MGSNRDIVPSAATLKLLLKEGGEAADAIRRQFHRTSLWRFTTGRGKPDADNIAVLARLSAGRVAADGWQSSLATNPAEASS